jgi:nucleoside-triphosphatase THEP1
MPEDQVQGPDSGTDGPGGDGAQGAAGNPRVPVPAVRRISPDLTKSPYERYKRDVPFVDWDIAGPELIRTWSRPDMEHIEIIGPSGSGKTTLEAWLLVQRAIHRNTGIIIICTKRADKSVSRIGFPIARNWEEARKHRQVIIWANPASTGRARREHNASVVNEVLEKLWVPDSNNLLAFDEIAYISSLGPESKDLVDMYLREGRSTGIELLVMKQRAQGVTREMHAETAYTFAFKPKDANDAERVAELFGDKRGLTPVLLGLKRDQYEFLAKSEKTDAIFISHLNGLQGTVMPQDGNTVFEKRRSESNRSR